MIDLQNTSDKILNCIGLMNALNCMAWKIEGVEPEFREAFNSVLSIGECLETGLRDIYGTIQMEL